jgi:hypothetical protein
MRKRAWQGAFLLGFVFVLLFGASGCSDYFSSGAIRDRGPGPGQPPVTTSYRFEDIPIPPEAVLNRKDSFVFETGRIKTGLLIYEAKGEMGQLATFFKQKMAQNQWRLVSNFELNNVMLIFMKEGMSAVVYLLPQEGEGKRIEIRVGPVDLKLVPAS